MSTTFKVEYNFHMTNPPTSTKVKKLPVPVVPGSKQHIRQLRRMLIKAENTQSWRMAKLIRKTLREYNQVP